MSDTNANPLNMSLNDMDTSIPLLATDTYDLRITKAEVGETKGANGAAKVPLLKLELVTQDPAKSVKDESLPAGQKVFTNIMLAPTGKSDWGMVGRNVAAFIQSAQFDLSPYGSNGMDQLRAVPTWHKMLEGRTVRAKVSYVPEGPDKTGVHRQAKNEVAYFSKR